MMTYTYCEKECLLKNVKSKLCIIFTMYVCNETSEPHVLNLYVSEGGFSVMLCNHSLDMATMFSSYFLECKLPENVWPHVSPCQLLPQDVSSRG